MKIHGIAEFWQWFGQLETVNQVLIMGSGLMLAMVTLCFFIE